MPTELAFGAGRRLSSESSFWLVDAEEEDDLGAVVSFSGATLEFPDDLVFQSLEVSDEGSLIAGVPTSSLL